MADFHEPVLAAIKKAAEKKSRLLVAIDGRCAAGKSTLALVLGEALGCNVLHMDHFFLRPEQRTKARLLEPGGNVDYERFLAEVLLPIKAGKSFSYRPYNCHSQTLDDAIAAPENGVAIVEGSYACHPVLAGYYDLKIFLSIEKKEQIRRIIMRNGREAAARFQSEWIPLEEKYFKAFQIPEQCDLRFD